MKDGMDLENIKCVFCNRDSNNVIIEENGYEGKKCLYCDLIYISPRPKKEFFTNLYHTNNANISADSHISSAFAAKIRAKHTLSIIKKFIKSGHMLEIGSGGGF